MVIPFNLDLSLVHSLNPNPKNSLEMETIMIKRLKTSSKDEQQSSSGFESLPREIMFDILSKLSISSLVRFNSASKAWRLLLSHDQALASDLAQSPSPSCLIFHFDSPIKNRLFFVDIVEEATPSFNKIAVPFCSSVPEYDVVGSCNGLLCLSDSLYNESVIIFNPFTRDFRELPKPGWSNPNPAREQEVVFGFGFSPVTNEYKVVRIINGKVHVLTLCADFDQSSWRSLGRVAHSLRRSPPPILVRGRLHWVATTGPRRRICTGCGDVAAAFDVAEEKFHDVALPEVTAAARPRQREWHLLEARGCLAAARGVWREKLEVWVMKEYGVRESWVREYVVSGSYAPKGIKSKMVDGQSLVMMMRKVKVRAKRCVRVLCVLKSGEVLLEYREKSKALVVFDPIRDVFKEFVVQGMPNYWFQTVVHFGSLNRIHPLIGI